MIIIERFGEVGNKRWRYSVGYGLVERSVEAERYRNGFVLTYPTSLNRARDHIPLDRPEEADRRMCDAVYEIVRGLKKLLAILKFWISQ